MEENIPENLKNELKDLNTDPEKCERHFRTIRIWDCRDARDFRRRY